MTPERESESAAERPIRRLLVRYGRSGNVAWFGTIHDLQVARGDAVVVLTALGEWPGVVLRSESTNAASSDAASLSGELLRRFSEADQARVPEALGRSLELTERARREASGLTVLEAEVSLCGRYAIVWFAGRGGPALGPAAARLADAVGLERVQWLALEAPAVPGDAAGPAGAVAAAEPKPEPNPGPKPEPGPARLALAALRATEPAELGRAARRAREPLGMLGAYVQKVRGGSGAEKPRTAASSERRWMIRVRATAGGLTLGQFEQLAQLAQRFGDGSLRLTMRQGLQMHGVVPGSAAPLLRAIEALAMTTRGSCGNAFRNVTCCPHPPQSPAAVAARQLAATITQQWLPRAEWLSWTLDADDSEADGCEADDSGAGDTEAEKRTAEQWRRLELDTAYPAGYLPHKWKVGVATAEDNCIDVLSNDVGLIVHSGSDGNAASVDCYVGGSLAYRPGETGSIAMLAEPLGRVAVGDVGEVLRGLAQVHRQASAAGPRHWRRLKYLVRRMGTRELAERIELAVQRRGLLGPIIDEPDANELRAREPRANELRARELRASAEGGGGNGAATIRSWQAHPPWTQGLEGEWTRTVGVTGGRLRFGEGEAGEAWLRLCRYGRRLRIGPRHTLVIEGLRSEQREAVDRWIAGPLAEAAEQEPWGEESCERVSPASGKRGTAPRMLACVALPTCPLAVAEAERTLGEWRRGLEPVVEEAALFASRREPQRPTAAVSGCSNGCSHPLTSTVGIVAEGPRQFRVFAGGNGRRLGVSLGTVAGPAELAERVRSAADAYRQESRENEEFIDWWNRCRNRKS